MNLATKHLTIPILAIVILLTILFNLGGTEKDISTYLPPAPTQTAAVSDFNSSLVAHYTFDGNTNDSAGSNNGTAVGGPTYTTGKIGQGLSFDGTDDKVTTSDLGTLGSSVSLSYWFKTTDGPNSAMVGIGTKKYCSIDWSPAGSFACTVHGGGGALSSGQAFNDGTWHHGVFVMTENSQLIYIDGVLKNSSNGELPADTSSAVLMGDRAFGGTPYSGALDDVRIYNKALSANEIQQLYTFNNESTPIVTPTPDTNSNPNPTPPPTTNPVPAPTEPISVDSKHYYVRPDGGNYGNEDGSSWANAFDGFNDVVWGNNTGQVGAGDVLYVSAGNYYQPLIVGISGVSGNRVTVRAAQDTYVGIANLNSTSAISYGGNAYVTIDGGYNGNNHFVTTTYINGQGTIDPGLHYFTINKNLADFRYSSKGEFSYNIVNIVDSTAETAFYFTASKNRDAPSFGLSKFHHNKIIVPGKINDGNGPDGIHAGTGFDIYNNIFQSVLWTPGSLIGHNHQDLIQAYGDEHLRIYNNEFIDSGDSQIDFSKAGNVTQSNLLVYNNVFRRTIAEMGTVMLRIYTEGGGSISSFNNIMIDNNTFIDGSRTGPSYGGGIRVINTDTATGASNATIRNNIFYNSGRAWPVVLMEGISPNWTVSNNLINAGSSGNATIQWTGINPVGTQTTAPNFVGYVPYALSMDLHLRNMDSAAINKGVNLSSHFSTDKDGNHRNVGGAWDIGAYEYQGSGTTQPPVTPPVTPTTYKPGDFNRDGAVNALDFSLLSGAWNTNTSTYDLNSDGIVNSLDYVIMVQNWTG